MTLDVTSIRGVSVGHAEAEGSPTGTTVLVFTRPYTTSHDPRGGWPGSYDTASVGMGKTFHKKQAIFLTGGDVFGYDAATGIRRFLLERGLASPHAGDMPEIVGTNIYDLEFSRRVESIDYGALGYAAAASASSGPVTQGSVGAGKGATVGKLRGMGYCWKGGLGSSAKRILDGPIVGAIVVTNAVGNIFDPSTGKTIAGTRIYGDRHTGPFYELEEIASEYASRPPENDGATPRATTVGVVVTNLRLSHEQTYKVVQMAHDGLARVIRPVHMTTDGDTLFAVSTDEVPLDTSRHSEYRIVDVIGEVAAGQVSKAVLNAVENARSVGGVPGLSA